MATGTIKNSGTWVTVNEYLDYQLRNGIVFVRIKKGIASLSTWTALGTIPFHPISILYFTLYDTGANDYVNVYVSTNGEVGIKSYSASVSTILSYPLE